MLLDHVLTTAHFKILETIILAMLDSFISSVAAVQFLKLLLFFVTLWRIAFSYTEQFDAREVAAFNENKLTFDKHICTGHVNAKLSVD